MEEPRKYRKKPVVIEALRYDGRNANQIGAWSSQPVAETFTGELVIYTLEDGANREAKHVASIGDFIIRGVKGEFYPCKPDIFAESYEPVVLIAEPTDAPSVAQLMEELNNALGHPPLGAQARTPKAVWEDLLLEVRNLAPAAYDRIIP